MERSTKLTIHALGKIALFSLIALRISTQAASFPGITEPLKQSTISAIVPGRIAAIHFKEGMSVKKGSLILELEKEEEEIEVARRKLIADSKTEINAAEHQANTLKQDYEATRKIFETTQSVSEEEVWKKELEYKMAKAELERLRIGETREELEYQIALAHLKQKQIAAPFDGIVVKLFLQVSESCKGQEPLVKVVNTSKCRFIAFVDAAASQGLVEGGKVDLRLGGRTSPVLVPGILDFVAPVIDPSSGLREVKAVFQNLDGKVQPGVSGTMLVADGK
jgi:RND family efflux transporter MFP subunit